MRKLQISLPIVVITMLGMSGCAKSTHHVGGIGDHQAKTYAMEGMSGYGNGRGLVPSNQTYYFDFDSNALHSADLKAVWAQANYLATHPTAKVRLEGNTDSRGSREYNVGLGWRRDQAVARIFEQAGVAPSQIEMVSYGKERPAVLGDDEAAWKLNRRVSLIYEKY